MSNRLKESSSIDTGLKHFVISNWATSTYGCLLGAVLGFVTPTLYKVAFGFGEGALRISNEFLAQSAVWPKRGVGTLSVILTLAVALYSIRLLAFMRRFWNSWRAGLMSGLGVIWFLTSAVVFLLLGLTGSYSSFFLITFGLAGTLAVFCRNLNLAKISAGRIETDPDYPICESGEDIIGRSAVVQTIVRAIVNDQAPVIALTGAYGDGKSSVLNLLSRALDIRKDVKHVRFSVWLPVTESALVASLLSSVLRKLEEGLYVPRIKRNLLDFTRMIFASIPGIPTSVKDLFGKSSQSGQIDELRRSLSNLPVRVAVLLDDMDRMHRGELDALLKLIRGVPEFPQFTYVCAFDQTSLAQMLQNSSSIDKAEDARHYLEKFFPEMIPLPKIELSLLGAECEKRLFAICDRVGLLKQEEERGKFEVDFRTLWRRILKDYLNNLRRVKLFTNRLNRSLPILGHEVNLKDLVILEVVRMMNPVIYEEIFRNARYFMFPGWRNWSSEESLHPDEEQATKMRIGYFNVLFHDLLRPPQGTLLALLKEIFPTVSSYLNGGGIPRHLAQNAEGAERERRIYHPDYFARYFVFQVPQDLFGEKELSDCIAPR
jgi:predicted KAP-like P-loop ATPase